MTSSMNMLQKVKSGQHNTIFFQTKCPVEELDTTSFQSLSDIKPEGNDITILDNILVFLFEDHDI